MLGKDSQLLSNEPVQVGQIYTSQIFTTDGYPAFVLIVHLAGAPTGTSPTLTWAVQSSADGINFAQVGAALPAMTPALLDQATLYASGSTQGAITGPYYRLVATPSGAAALFPRVYAEMVALGL